ncbi:MAG: hypothetical protein H7Y32_12595 [Chloroflexales bacterium]|nr:hypothetical protein [Chloroflexales bacterium]
MSELPGTGDGSAEQPQTTHSDSRRSERGQRLVQLLREPLTMLTMARPWPWLEAMVIVLWGLFVTRLYLNLNPYLVPTGREYLSVIQSHHFWTWVGRCGACAMWNGGQQGGAPALVELHGSPLHPIVMVTTLLFGVVNGSKLALVLAFIIAGLAQWWLCWVLGLGRVARVWSACMVIVGGHLAARMANGLFGVVLSSAAASLVLPPILLMGRSPTQRTAVLLGMLLALAAVAGQGYQQIGLVCLLGVVLPLQLLHSTNYKLLLRRYALSGVLAALVASTFLLPLLHFLPQFVKNSDPEFKSSQPFAYMLVNLLINDSAFYATDLLHKLPYPDLYSFFIGWIPLLLAILGAYRGWAQERNHATQQLLLGALAILWLASGAPLVWLASQPLFAGIAERLTSIRYPSLIAGLAVPLLLALAAFAVDRMLRFPWPKLGLNLSSQDIGGRSFSLGIGTRWLLLIPLLLALNDARVYGAQWLTTYEQAPEIKEVLQALRTPDLQWVNPPFGEHFFIEPAVGMGLKLNQGVRQWGWQERQLPQAQLEATREGAPPGMAQQATVAGAQIFAASPGREYAAITHQDGSRTICTARGAGGDIDVTCDAPQSGRLEIKENTWSGWGAQLNGAAAALLPGQWLAVDVPAGKATVQFRYRPWDVPLGLLLTLCGLVLGAVLWHRRLNAAQELPTPPIIEKRGSVAAAD